MQAGISIALSSQPASFVPHQVVAGHHTGKMLFLSAEKRHN